MWLCILDNLGMTHSVPTAFIMMNAVGTEEVTPGLSRVVIVVFSDHAHLLFCSHFLRSGYLQSRFQRFP